MTRDEAIKYFKRHLDLYCVDGISREAEEMAIKALSQEPTEDWYKKGFADGYEQGRKDAEQKSGKWIDYSDEGYVECPFCGYATTCEDNIDELHYCFYCGARMDRKAVRNDNNPRNGEITD